MKKHLLAGLLLVIFGIDYGQAQTTRSKLTASEVDAALDKWNSAALNYVTNRLDSANNLVSVYTFRSLIRRDFSSLTGISNATVGKFASLSIDPATSVLAFSPYTRVDKDLVNNSFRNIFSVDFSATLDSKKTLDLSSWRKITGSLSWTRVISEGYGNNYDHPSDAAYSNLYGELKKDINKHYASVQGRQISVLNNKQFDDLETLQQQYLDSIAKYELLITQPFLKSKHFWWVKATFNAASFDNVNYIITGNTDSYQKPVSHAYYTPSMNVSIHYYKAFKNGFNLYASGSGQIGLKDEFAEVYTASVWNSTNALTSTTSVQADTKNIFQVAREPGGTKIKPDFGLEGVLLFPTFLDIGLGLNLSQSWKGVIANQPDRSLGFASYSLAGVVVSFKDKTGASTVNVEPYFQFKHFIAYTLPDTHVWGVKFSLPISRLY